MVSHAEVLMRFERHDLVAALVELGADAWAAGKIIDLYVYGGSCLMLVSDVRVSSADVDMDVVGLRSGRRNS